MKMNVGIKWILILSLSLSSVLYLTSCSTTEESAEESGEEVASEEESTAEEGEEAPEGDLDSELAEDSEDSGEESSEDSEPQETASEEAVEEPAEQEDEPELFSTEGSRPTASIREVKYLSEVSGGTIAIESNAAVKYKIRPGKTSNQHVIEIQNVILPDRFKRPYITKEFMGPFVSFEAYQAPSSSTARMLIQAKQSGTPSITQRDNILFISASDRPIEAGQIEAVKQVQANEESALTLPTEFKEQPMLVDENMVLKSKSLYEYLATNTKFYGKKISIEVRNGEVRDVLSFIAETSGLNMIVDDQVQGTISMKLSKIPWDQALIIVLQTKRLGYIRQGNVLRIAPLISLKEEADEANSILESRKKLEDLVMRVVSVSYADVIELEKQVKPFLTAQRGQLSVDKRTSSVVITDVPSNVDRVEKLIKQLDTPPPQVLIEGKVVEAQDNFNRDFGFNWNMAGDPTTIGRNRYGAPVTLTPSISVSPTIPRGQGLDVGLSVGTMNLFGDISAQLALAENEQKVKVLSSPRISALHNEEAEILQTTEIPIISLQPSTVAGQQPLRTVTFKEVQLKLKVTPQVTSDESVMLKIEINRDVPGAKADAQDTNAISINKRQARTKVLVRNGQTAVIGGIYQNDTQQGTTGVPFLKDIPFLGYLFKYQNESNQRNELLIFLTPRILAGPISSTIN